MDTDVLGIDLADHRHQFGITDRTHGRRPALRGAGDLRLQAGSAAVDNAAATSATTDLDAAATNVGVGVDMGAFERQGFLAGSASVVAEGGFETQTSVTTASGPWFGEGTHAFGVDVAAGVAHSGSDNG